MLPTLYCGGVVVIMKKFGGSLFQELVERERCTHAFMVPTQLVVTTAEAGFQAEAFGSMRLIMVSGSPLAPHTFDELRTRLPSISLCEIYGMGEGFMTFVGPVDYALGKAGSVGRPIAAVDTDIQILDENDKPVASGEIGEIVGTSAFLLTQYYRDAVRTQEALWHDDTGRPYLRSGDLGRFDEDGYLYIVGRKKDMIISGGVKIYSVDLEDVFMQHPDVLEVAAIGIPHEKWGETPLILAIMRNGATVREEQLRDWANGRLGKAQRVSRVEFRESFPRNALEKILKRELREAYWHGRSRDI
jgi:acyl-CoA synthetase (AMP-forming)/AMP-acid ligase II